MRKKFTTISVPTPLFEKVKKRIKGTGFTSVSSFATFLLREFVSWSQETKGKESSIREKLERLGYL